MSRRFVLLDRDGTINVEKGYVLDPADLELVPGAIEGLRELKSLGLGLVVATNQSPIGRGLMTRERLDEVHARLSDLLREGGVVLEGVHVCPHTPEDGCDCRKPRTRMARAAAEQHAFRLTEAFVVGDQAADVQMGRAVGATTILLLTGHGEEELAGGAGEFTDHVVADLPEAALVIRDIVLAGSRG